MKHRLSPYIKPYLKQTILGPFFKFLEAIMELTLPLLLARIIDKGIGSHDRDVIFQTGALMLAVIIIGFVFAVICQYYASVASQGFGDQIRKAIFRHVNRLTLSDQSKMGAEGLLVRLTTDVNHLQLAVSMLIRLGTRYPFIIAGSILATLMIDPYLAGVILLASVLFIAVMLLIIKKVFPLYDRLQKYLDRIGGIVQESVLGVRFIRAFNLRFKQRGKVNEAIEDHEKTAHRVARLSALMNPSTQLIMNLAICGVLWVGAVQIDAGHLTTGQLVAVFNYVLQILTALMVVAGLTMIFTRAAVARRRVLEVLELSNIEDFSDQQEKKDALTTDGDAKTDQHESSSVFFSGVSFSYSDSISHSGHETERYVLNNIDFSVEPGQVLGVIGTTGSGKTTLLSLCAGLYRPTAGVIRIMGQDIQTLSADQIRQSIAVVPQNTRLFYGSIADNLRMGDQNADIEMLKEATRISQALSFIEPLSDKFDTVVQSGGRNFSGGQKQRLAIARAIVKNSRIIALDDAASALDHMTETDMFGALYQHVKKTKKTLIIISQHISAVKNADNIVVLDEGRQVGQGSHERLYETCPEYRAVADSQDVSEEVS